MHSKLLINTLDSILLSLASKSISLNAYSCNPNQYERMVEDVIAFKKSFHGESKTQKQSLSNLKRGAYIRNSLKSGDLISENDVFYAMPCQEGQLDASKVDNIVGSHVKKDMKKNEMITGEDPHQENSVRALSSLLINCLDSTA